MIKVKRNNITIKKMAELPESDYMKTSPGERIAFIWELTSELWSLKESGSAERRLQRNVAALIKQ
ncbi:MAG: hypothetical protein V1871_07805 [Planctomycetota bacterium]